jgi:O-6-methylguanine DNA methyltransferase
MLKLLKKSVTQTPPELLTACGSNRLAVEIPCHRVISKSGRLGGYRWGAERKKLLFDNKGCIAIHRNT